MDSKRWPTRNNVTITAYADVVRELGAAYHVNVLYLWALQSPVVVNDLNDGLHFGESANKKLLDGLKKLLREYHSALCPDDDELGLPKVPLHFPHWKAIVGKSREETEDIVNNF